MKTRIITAIVLLAILVPVIILGGIFFEVIIALLSALALRELFSLYEKNIKIPLIIKILSYLSVVILSICSDALLPCIGLIVLFLMIPIVFFKDEEYNFNNAISLLGIVLFTGFLFYNVCYIRFSSLDEFIYVISITILTDTFAYIGGKTLGKHKLLPRVSPNKTIEGSVIGLIVGTIIPSIYYLYEINQSMNISLIILMTVLLSIIGQLGDLLFSSIKRHYKVKDFSNLFPGHGGVLDRFDSILIVSILYIIIKIIFL